MNKEEITKRVAQIHAEMETCKATYAKLEGHFAEANHWMQELHKKEAEEGCFEQVEACLDAIDMEPVGE